MTTYKTHRMNFALEPISPNLAFIKVRGIRRGHVARLADDKWLGQLEGRKCELSVQGNSLDSLQFVGILFNFKQCPRHKFWSRIDHGQL